ncbi:TetR family transcriptional regulator [Mycobacterium antarcticum]|uniref:TetR/AcrR family transcriptional regulator n=1 Tax=unclassified Mycolicibacterium TaxID=2636767 RepID=UPI0023A3CB0D|nr:MULTISPECIES: TetR/AcrR family transcriptional regulator [unclassified Mycolicibacterium]BDX30497.1 TetR family transcriptional regulator [Mycolicibacterium sp. TUM20985]GLP79620.1 TetR family transcriptional regulator [Mycolicibacterium sp. TUM20984]
MAERWTRERRAEHIRSVLLDAAEEVFARKGLSGAALEDIADVAGFTRGAIYSQFGAKEKLFLAVVERQRQQFLDGFAEVMQSFHTTGDINIDELAIRWRDLSSGTDRAALGYELSLLLLRNPEAREGVAAQRLETIRALGDFIDENVARIGGTLSIPAETLARVVIAASDGITISSHLDGEDLYRPYLQLVMSSILTTTVSTPH